MMLRRFGAYCATVLTTEGRELCFSEENSCSVCGWTFPQISSQLFSFNSPVGACPSCNGFGNILSLDESKVVPNPNLSLSEGTLHPFTMPSAAGDKRLLMNWAKKQKINAKTPWKQLSAEERSAIWTGDENFFGVVGLFEYLETKKYKMHVRVFLSRYKSPFQCPTCKGSRLKPEIRYVKVGGHTFSTLLSMTIGDLYRAMMDLKLTPMQEDLAGEILRQVRSRLLFLNDVGVDYLTLDRATRTLSGGEFQRLNLGELSAKICAIIFLLW
jgi:excinuclease ABC subunit A